MDVFAKLGINKLYNMRKLIFISLIALLSCAVGCKDDNKERDYGNPPEITLKDGLDLYSVKIGRTVTIAPAYTNCENAVYVWKCDGKVIGRDPELRISFNELGEKYIDLDVTNSAGYAFKQFTVKVLQLAAPVVSLSMPENGYKMVTGSSLEISPEITNAIEGTTYSWSVNGSSKGTEKNFKFSESEKGTYKVALVVKNEDGEDKIEFDVVVCTPDELPFKWSFEKETFNMSTGRRIRIKAFDVENAFDSKYEWKITKDGKEIDKTSAEKPEYIFDRKEQGEYKVLLTMKNSYVQLSKELTVNVCPPEGTYKRAVGTSNKIDWDKVYEYMPAPGQFINEGWNCYTMEEAITYAESRFTAEAYVCLGGFGGYIVVGFDHSVENDGEYNLQILGNSFAGSSEPGIVWVMQDENGDGLPNDTWYELKGCETEKGTQTQDYAVTYYRPKAPGLPVSWTDNKGQKGTIDYLSAFHRQDYYYPLWVKEDTYVLRGTCLPLKNRETSPGYWYNGEFDWGYADNFSPIDRLTDDINYSANANGNHFKISHAIDFEGKPVNLKYVDFVKVVTGVNGKSGWLGEISTEVFGIKDFNMFKGKKK